MSLSGVFTRLLVLALAGLPLTAASQSSDEPQPVRVQLKWAHQFQFAGYYAAIDQGYYRDAGLSVQLLEYSPASTPIDQLIGGRVEFSVADAGALLYRAAGVPLVALAAIFQNSPSVLMTLEASGIESLQDMRNRRAMLPGGFMNAELIAMLQSAGIAADELQLLPAVTSLQQLINGETDIYNAYTTNEPYFLDQLNIPYRFFIPQDYGVDFYGDTLITTEGLISSNPQMVKNFLDATLRGWSYAVQNPEEVVDLILRDYNTQQKTREHLLFEAYESIQLILPNVVPIGYMSEERWRRTEAIFTELGHMAQPIDMNRFIYNNNQEPDVTDLLWRYRAELILGSIALIAILLLTHILRLRALVDARTRELQESKQHAEVEARTDALTGLPNRRHFLEELSRYVAQAERYGLQLTIIALDIDHFKNINDRHGHAAGDKALEYAAAVFRKHIRTSDLAARIGGEEFAVACLNTNLQETRNLAERLCQEMQDTAVSYRDKDFDVTFSAGLVQFEKGDDIEQLLRKADLALYEAKDSGRNTICEWRQDSSPA